MIGAEKERKKIEGYDFFSNDRYLESLDNKATYSNQPDKQARREQSSREIDILLSIENNRVY